MAFILLLPVLALATSKVDELRQLAEESQTFIELSGEDYFKYVVDYPRPYTLVVYFTADPQTIQCQPCQEIEQMLGTVIYSYKEAGAQYPQTSPSKSRAVFFAKVTYSQENHQIFQSHGFVSVPNLIVTHPKSVVYENNRFTVPKEDIWEFHGSGDLHPQKILDFVNNRAARNIELKTPPINTVITLLFVFLVLGVGGVLIYKLHSFLLSPVVWYLGGVLVYFICISGVVYNIIHSVPMIGVNQRTGEPEMVHPGQRTQYGAEGFMMGFMMCLVGISFVGLNNIRYMESPKKMRIAGYLVFLLGVYATLKIITTYKLKSPWYGPGIFPPEHYVKGSFMRDQGNSF